MTKPAAQSPSDHAVPATNADRVAPLVGAIKAHAAAVVAWARANPDEAALAAAPLIGVVAATRRHHLSFGEALILSELGYWCGLLAVREYRRWKTQPATAPPWLRKVS